MISRDFLLGFGAGKAAGGGGGGGGGTGVPAKDVNFIDYDGTIVNAYSAADFANLTALPDNPTHTGLTAQGWNWTLAQIKEQFLDMPESFIYVGQMYTTDDEKTRIYIHLEKRLSPYLGLGVNGSVEIDWGDGSPHDTVVGTSSTPIYTQHTYESAGDYIISFSVDGKVTIAGEQGVSTLLSKNSGISSENYVYTSAIQKIELGENIYLGNYSFSQCYSLETITMPSTVKDAGSFQNCRRLKSITIPRGKSNLMPVNGCSSLESISVPIETVGSSSSAVSNCVSLMKFAFPKNYATMLQSVFSGCGNLKSVSLSNKVTSIESQYFRDCFTLESFTIPSSVTVIKANAFLNCYGLLYLKFKSLTPPAVDNANAFSGLPTDCIIYVPASADHSVLNAYKAADNYPDPATYTYMEE